MSTDLPAWPEADAVGRVSNRELYVAAMARLRLLEQHAREVLQWRKAFFDWTQNDQECFCSSEVLCDFDNLEYALTAIGELPPETKP